MHTPTDNSKLYYDLDVRVNVSKREDALLTLHRLGYGVVAFTTVYSEVSQLTAQSCPTQRMDVWTAPSASTIGGGAGLRSNAPATITVLERAHLVIDELRHLALLQSPYLSRFAIISVAPSSEKLLHTCLQSELDIIRLSLSTKRIFNLKKQHVNVAVDKGVVFEICYAPMLRSRDARRFTISNACRLSRQTAGKHLIVSSSAVKNIELRGAKDVENLATVFGLRYETARAAVSGTPSSTVKHSDIRLNTTKGIVRVIEIDQDQPSVVRVPDEDGNTDANVDAEMDGDAMDVE